MLLNTNTYSQIDFPFLLETYKAIKSVPPVEAFPLNAKTIEIP